MGTVRTRLQRPQQYTDLLALGFDGTAYVAD
jgi:hypothetical protein